MGVVVHGEVCQPGARVGVDHDLVSLETVDDNALAGHRVLVVVFVVLIKDRSHFLPIFPDAKQRLLVVVCGDMEHEEVLAAHRDTEDARVRIEATSNIAVNAVEREVLLATAVVCLAPGKFELNQRRHLL